MKIYIKSSKYPDFEQQNAAASFLSSVDKDKVAFVSACRQAILEEYGKYDYDGENPVGPRVSEVIRDYKSAAAEGWEDCTVFEADVLFDDIMNALDVIHADDAAAWT